METSGNHLDKYPHKQIEAITKVLQRGDIDNVDFAVNKLIEYVQSSKATLSTSRCIYYDVVSQIIKESYQLEQITKEHIQLDYDIFSFVQRSSINDLSDMLKNVCLDLCMKRKRISTNISDEISDILNYIDNNCCDPNFSLQLVSDKFNISLAKLSVSFKSEFGYNPIDYILKQKIGRAKELLVSSESNVKDIALMVGYNDVSSFTRKFRETVGVTPAFYRKMHSSEV
jgi:AraC-like DNA-binding protein